MFALAWRADDMRAVPSIQSDVDEKLGPVIRPASRQTIPVELAAGSSESVKLMATDAATLRDQDRARGSRRTSQCEAR
jgi:hypothetical protein